MHSIISSLENRSATQTFSLTTDVFALDLETIVKAFNLTPTSFGIQPIRLYIVYREDAIKLNLSKYCYGQQQVEQASHTLIICTEDIDDEFIDRHIDLVNKTNNSPLGYLSGLKTTLSRFIGNRQFAANQAYIALGNLITVLAMLEIDACPMEGFNTEDVSKVLELDKIRLKPIIMLPIGYKSINDSASKRKKVRKPLDEIVSFHYLDKV